MKKPVYILLLFVIVAYLPVFLPFFHLKNDLISQNLPTRYIIGESLYSGYFPWWNPYIHYGIPQYGDMNVGFWNPVMWVIAKFFGYNIWTITFEEMLCVFISGWGMYLVLKELGIKKGIALIMAISYMSCGYTVGHLQHFVWIRGVAFFPFVLLCFLRISKQPTLKNYIIGALSVFLFVASTHPGLIIGAGYFMLFAMLFIFLFRKTICSDLYHPKFFLVHFIFLLFSAAFSIVVIVSNLDVLRHISRGHEVGLAQSLLQPTTFQSYLSLMFPLAVNKSSFFATDISMRNVYTGVAGLAGFTFFLRSFNRKIILAVLVPLLFFILLSSGGVFKTAFQYVLPLLGYIRLNGEFTYFVILILIFAAAFGIQQLLPMIPIKKNARPFLVIFLVIMITAVCMMLFTKSSVLYAGHAGNGDFKTTIKQLIGNIQFPDLLFISAFIQLVTVFLISRRFSFQRAAMFTGFNLVIITWLALPFTGLGMNSKKEINDQMTMGSRGIHAPELQPLNQTKFLDSSLEGELLLISSYSKKIGYPKEEVYPVQLLTTESFFKDSALHNFINHQSYIFLSTDTTVSARTSYDSAYIHITAFGPGHLKLTVNNTGYRFITFLQNDYPYWQTYVDGKKWPHFTAYKTFITLPLQGGIREVEFRFEPTLIKTALWINSAVIILGLLILCIRPYRIKYILP